MDIAVIDYGIGNLRSAEKALQRVGLDASLTTDPAALGRVKKIVLPGVGNFGECVKKLGEQGFTQPLLAAVRAGTPLLGICVGLQMLFESSEESPKSKGLGLLKGRVRRFSGGAFEGPEALKVPHIGWNALEFVARPHPLFNGIAPGSFVYFVHSYYACPEDAGTVLASSEYGGPFCAAAGAGNVMGTQFHPEKSQTAGLAILKNFGEM
jgi:glutamine amidotransferase